MIQYMTGIVRGSNIARKDSVMWGYGCAEAACRGEKDCG